MRAGTAGAVLVTRGPDGAVVIDDAGGAWRVGAPPSAVAIRSGAAIPCWLG